MIITDIIQTHQEQLTQIAKDFDLKYLALFGSYARNEADKTSDVDLLFDYEQPLGLFKMVDLQNSLEHALNKKVDLVSKRGVSKYLRKYIKPDLRVIYEKK